jgi:NAD(P)-dependent dehydrogenase (short-subunit alcohol dehydrogenase family)
VIVIGLVRAPGLPVPAHHIQAKPNMSEIRIDTFVPIGGAVTPSTSNVEPGKLRRKLLFGAGLLASAAVSRGATSAAGPFDDAPQTVNGEAMPKPPAERTAGAIRAGRGSALAGKVAVVTGAARGIGRAIAVEFAANGADVVVIDIAGFVSPASDATPATPDELAETVQQVRSFGRRCDSIRADIRRIAELRVAADQVEKDYGKIDIVVADAAIQRWKPLLEMQDSDWIDVIDNNLNGTANTIRAFAPKLVARGRGRIIVLSSMQGKHGTKDGSSYSASKWGILGLMKSAALELGQYNITVNALLPGLVDTPLTRYSKRLTESIAETGRKPSDQPKPQEAWDVRKPTVPMQVGWLQPEDIAPVAVFLASDAAQMVTGADYEVTGGDSAKSV